MTQPTTKRLLTEANAAAGYQARGDAVRTSGATLPTWTRKLQLSLFGQSAARVLCVGDSTTAGVYSDSYTTATGSTNQGGPNSYPARLAAYLTARGIPAIYAMGVPGHSGNEDSRWSLGSASYFAGVGPGGNAGISLGPGQSSTFTPGVKADTYRIYYYSDSGTGVLSGQATGGSATAIATSNATPAIRSSTITASSSSAANAVALTGTSGACFVAGIEYWDSANPNVVRILPAGVGSSQATNWANDANNSTYGGRAFIAGVAPDLTVISLGINDAAAGRSATQILTDVSALVTVAAASGDALLVSAFPAASGFTDAVNAAYLSSTYPYVDLAGRYGHNMQARGLMTTDGIHPNALGYGDVAAVIGRTLATI